MHVKSVIIFSAAHIIITSDKAWDFFCKKFNLSSDDLLKLRKKYIDPAKEGKLTKNQLLERIAYELSKDKKEIEKIFSQGGRLLEINPIVMNFINKLIRSINSTTFYYFRK